MPGRKHPATVTSDRIMAHLAAWPDLLTGHAAKQVAAELDSIAAMPSPGRKLAGCGSESAYRRHLRRGEPADAACLRAHADEKAKWRERKKAS